MSDRLKENSAFFISVTLVLTVTAGIVISVYSLRNAKISFEAEYWFVCYSVRDNVISADAISDTVSSYGGAGYVLEYDGDYYVTVACYYSENDADRVRQSLLRRGLDCSILKVETDEYTFLALGASRNRELYTGNLTTLYSLSKLCYDCANALDTGEYNQSAAKGVLGDVKSGLSGLKNANGDNCFSSEIRRLIAECEAVERGYVYSKDMRKLQIAIADTVINIKLY